MPEDSAVAPAPTTTVPDAGEVTATSYGGVVTDTVTVELSAVRLSEVFTTVLRTWAPVTPARHDRT